MKIRTLGPIGHCSARLRRALEIEEEAALRWTIKVKRDPDLKKGSGGKRWVVRPNFGVPGALIGRPLSPLGHVSFHFAVETVTKGPGGKSMISSGSRSRDLSGTAAADHESYVSRPDAVLTISPSDFEHYTGRPAAVVAQNNQAPAILTNISDNADERAGFWKSVHEHERQGRPDRIVFKRDRLAANEWLILADASTLPESVREIAGRMAKMLLKASKSKGDAWLEIDAREAIELCEAARALIPSWDSRKKPIRVVKGRNGRTQTRFTAEFPSELDVAGRLRVTQAFCENLAAQGHMYTAAIHAPDPHNDERNHHLHIAAYDRPCRFMEEFGLWDFEVKRPVPGQAGRYNYPYRQPKIAEVCRNPEGRNPRGYRAGVIFAWREQFADLCNAELARRGIGRHFDPRRYSVMGIKQEPTKPLGPRAAPLEAAGIPTATGIRNAEIQWTAALNDARKAAEKTAKARKLFIQEVSEAAQNWTEAGNALQASRLRNLRNSLERHADILEQHEAEIGELRITQLMAYSRSEKTVDTTNRLLKAVDEGKGTKRDRADRELIAARKREAALFQDDLDEIFLGQLMPEVQPILDRVDTSRAQFAKFDAEARDLLAHAPKARVLIPAAIVERSQDKAEEPALDVPVKPMRAPDTAELGLRLNHSQKATAVASATPERKLAASLS